MRSSVSVLVCVVLAALACDRAHGVMVSDYMDIRELTLPEVHPPPGCLDRTENVQLCGPGPGFPAGISNAGDVYGIVETNFPHLHHNEDGIQWLRRNSYVGENTGKAHPFLFSLPDITPFQSDLDNFVISQAFREVLQPFGVELSEQTFVEDAGGGTPDDPGKKWAFVDANDNFRYKAVRQADGSANVYNQKTKAVHWGENPEIPGNRTLNSVTSEGFVSGMINVANFHTGALDPTTNTIFDLDTGIGAGGNNHGLVVTPSSSSGVGTVSRISSIHAISEVNPFGRLQNLSVDGVFGISDANVIVGEHQGDAIKIEPLAEASGDGFPQWGDFTVMEKLGDANAFASSVSDSDPAYAIGSSSSQGVVWNVNDGTIAGNFGLFNRPLMINPAGTIAVGLSGRRQVPVMWTTDDGWANSTMIAINEILDAMPSADDWIELTSVRGVNDAGQIVGNGTKLDFSTGAYLLDTLALLAVLKGDVDNDGNVNNLDITPFIAALAAGNEAAFLVGFPDGSYAAADIDMIGGPNNLDITPFIALLASAAGQSAAVPEPASLALLALSALTAGRPRSKTRA